MDDMKNADRIEDRSSFFSHRECAYFPCHIGVAPEEFNCLFCYCPLYALGKACGGNFRILENGVKDCSGCTLPHRKENYEKIVAGCQQIVEMLQQDENPIP